MSKPYKIRIIPASGRVIVADVFTGSGECKMNQCRKKVGKVQRHYKNNHLRNPIYATVKVIPASGTVKVADLTTSKGKCKMAGCNKRFRHLRRHFETRHSEESEAKRRRINIIPSEGEVTLESVPSGPGKCEICNKKLTNIRAHFRYFHLRIRRRQCPTCGKEFSYAAFKTHLESHSGPAKCLLCPARCESMAAAKLHMKRNHKGVKGVKPELLSPDKVAAFRLAQEEARLRTAMRNKARTVITGMRIKQQKYEERLRDPNDPLSHCAQMLKLEFENVIDVPPSALVSFNASFVSVWNPEWKAPKLVFEVVGRTTIYELFSCSTFYPDPKLRTPTHPTNNDYARSGYHRGHLAAAANYHELWMVVPTYYYSNALAMTPTLNMTIRWYLEHLIRETAHENDGAVVVNFPLMDGPDIRIGTGVKVPRAVGTVMILTKPDGLHITAWELPNSNNSDRVALAHCLRDPFSLMDNAGISLKLSRESFVSWSHDAR